MNVTTIENNAELIRENRHGLQLRRAKDRTQTWPGYDASFPLDRPGYWIGTHRKHDYVSTSLEQALREWDYLNCED
jgi:hypothetical protein